MIARGRGLVLADRLLPGGSLRVAEGLISEVGMLEPGPGEAVVERPDCWIAPGLIDGHVHGALGRDAMEATPEAWATICRYHATGGTTALALTTVTATPAEIGRVLDLARSFSRPADGAALLGIHVEGPYFSPAKPGAHRVELIHAPDPAEYRPWLDRGVLTQMTLAPELPGAGPLIAALTERGIVASGGHSDAWDEEAAAAFVSGMRQVTHTWNCMSTARRRGPFRVAGLLEWALSEPEVTCELIADGRHVSPTLMRMLWQAKGAEGISLVTDATAGAGLAEGAHFQLSEVACVVRDEVGLTADGEALAGSTANMIRLVRNMVERVGVPLPQAVAMASRNPARALGLGAQRGELRAGLAADWLFLTEELQVAETWIGGVRVVAA